jgi:hypothetical protein
METLRASGNLTENVTVDAISHINRYHDAHYI